MIRFEMPFNVWCLACSAHIARGVRFNAEKSKAGAYYSTTVWSFALKCPRCSSRIEVQTDPKASDYVVTAGARRQLGGDPAEPGGGPPQAPASNAFFHLERSIGNERAAQEALPRLSALIDANERSFGDSYASSKRVRRAFREGTAADASEEGRRRAREEGEARLASRIASRDPVEILPEDPADVAMARNLLKRGRPRSAEERTHVRAGRLGREPILPAAPSSRASPSAGAAAVLQRTEGRRRHGSIREALALGGSLPAASKRARPVSRR